MTPEHITYELVAVLNLGFVALWLLERRRRGVAQGRVKKEFDARVELVVEKSLEIGALRKRIEQLETSLRGHPYSFRDAPPTPPTCGPNPTLLDGDYTRSVRHPPKPLPPPPTRRIDG